MLERLLSNKKQVFLIAIAICFLMVLRLFEKALFYDPFLDFYKADFQSAQLPQYDSWPLFFGLFFRYVLNSALSVAIIHLVFNDLALSKFVSVLYLIFFTVLIVLFFGMLSFSGNPDYMFLFYVRRFLIQPLFLVLFLPAFYYQKRNL